MIINSVTRELETSEGLQVKGFGIDVNNAKAFDILSSALYKNKPLAIIRELSCNAYDAHIAAGKKDVPIWVHVPTSLEPFFSVRDEGIGLSHDDVMSLYSTYFASTKASSNDFVGAFGLGSKSPFSYVDSFTVTSIYNGEKRIYSAFKSDKGTPSITCLHTENTNLPNGVEINVPVKMEDLHTFNTNATNFFKTFTPSPIINISIKPLDIVDQFDNITVLKSAYGDTVDVGIKQGNVVYPVDMKTLMGTNNYYKSSDYCTIIEVPIGSVEVTAGREEISYTKNVIAYLKDLLINTKKAFKDHIETDLAKCKSLYEALQNYKSYYTSSYFYFGDASNKLTYRGKPLVYPSIELNLGTDFTDIVGYKYNVSRYTKDNIIYNYRYNYHSISEILFDKFNTSSITSVKFNTEEILKDVNGLYHSVKDSIVIVDVPILSSISNFLKNNNIEKRAILLYGTDIENTLNKKLEDALGEKNLACRSIFKVSELINTPPVPVVKAKKSTGTLKGFKLDEVEDYFKANPNRNAISNTDSVYRPIELKAGGYYITSGVYQHKYELAPNTRLYGANGLNSALKTLKIIDDNTPIYLFPKQNYKTLDKYASIWKDLEVELKTLVDTYKLDKDLQNYFSGQNSIVEDKDILEVFKRTKSIKSKYVEDIIKEYNEFVKDKSVDPIKEAKLVCMKFLRVDFDTLPAVQTIFTKGRDLKEKFPLFKDRYWYSYSSLGTEEVKYINAISYIEENDIKL